MSRCITALRVALVLTCIAAAPAAAQVPAPDAFFGFRMGSDGKLADWPSIQRYFETVAAASDRVDLVDAGPSTEGRRLIGAVVSAPENIRRLSEIQAANRLLADPRRLPGEDEVRALIGSHKVVLVIGCSIHATEIGATQAANELLYEMATATDARTLAVLRDVVLILLPSLNPDGHTIVVDWQRKVQGTPFEGGPMPWMYHKYVDHDINRDMFMLNMAESRTLARFFSREWHPQVFLAMHQMGPSGPRMFVPPNFDPIDPNQDPLIWREAGLLGGAMAMELESQGKSGVISNAMYDYYWPGYEDSAPLGRNTVCLLAEVASARVAMPVEVAAKDLHGTPRGLPQYAPQINFPNPWPGGTWRLRDVVDYDLVAMRALLSAASRYREDIVSNFVAMGRRSVARGNAGAPFAFVVPPDQFDQAASAKLINLLVEGGVEVQQAQEPFNAGSTTYASGTSVVLMAQPFRAYAKSLLEAQRYPVRRPGGAQGPPERPYDVAGWTLPYQMGVRVDTIEKPFEPPVMSRLDRAAVEAARVLGNTRPGYFLVDARANAGAIAINRLMAAGLRPEWTVKPFELDGYRYAAGTLVVESVKTARPVVERLATELGIRVYGARGRQPATLPLFRARTALYRPWSAAIDEGWTRWLLERYEFPFRTLRDADIRRGNLRDDYDVIILPAMPAARIVEGNRAGSLPEEYTGGLGELGVGFLKLFVEAGGTLVALDSSSQLAIDALALPVKNILRDVSPEKFFCPGSVVRLDLDPAQPLGFGMQEKNAAFFSFGSAFDVSAAADARVVARYGKEGVLMSGWLDGEAVIAGQPAVVEVRAGMGRAVLIGFRAQHRGQSHATFRLLFNAILGAGSAIQPRPASSLPRPVLVLPPKVAGNGA